MEVLEPIYVTVGLFTLIICIYWSKRRISFGNLLFIIFSFITSFISFFNLISKYILETLNSGTKMIIEIPMYMSQTIQGEITRLFSLSFFVLFTIYLAVDIIKICKKKSHEGSYLADNHAEVPFNTSTNQNEGAKYNFVIIYLDTWKNIENWTDRATIRNYIKVLVIHSCIVVVTFCIKICVATIINEMWFIPRGMSVLETMTDAGFMLYQLLSFFPLMSLTVRKCNDAQISKLYSLFFIIPYLVWIIIMILYPLAHQITPISLLNYY